MFLGVDHNPLAGLYAERTPVHYPYPSGDPLSPITALDLSQLSNTTMLDDMLVGRCRCLEILLQSNPEKL